MKLKLLWSIPLILLVLFNLYCKQSKVGHWPGKGGPQKVELENTAPQTPVKAATPEDAAVKMVGPLANWMAEQGENEKPQSGGVQTYVASEQDHIILTPSSGPNNFLHTTFPVDSYASFEIQIPPGTVGASLNGSFESFIKAGQGRRAANVQVFLLDENEVREFAQGNPGSATYATDPSTGQAVRWALHSDYKQAKKYYLVFSNAPGGSRTKLVKANFTVQFD